MKKLMFVAAAVAASVAVAEGITSANVVGYQTFANNPDVGNVTAGAAFTPVNATGKWTCETKVFDTEVAADDTVYVFNIDPAIWDFDYYCFKGYEGETPLGWTFTTTDPEQGEMYDTDIESFELAQGDQVIYQPNDGESGVTISGEVTDTTKSATWVLPADSDMATIMNPYPVDTMLATLEDFALADDTVYVFNTDPAIWDFDYYCCGGAGNSWTFTTTDPDSGEMYDTEITPEEAATRVVLPAGQGGIYQASDTDGRTWTVTL